MLHFVYVQFTVEEGESDDDAESQISMEEARLRIQDMLDDAFHSMKKYKKKFGNDDTTLEFSPTKQNKPSTKSNSLPRKHRDTQQPMVTSQPLSAEKARAGTLPMDGRVPLLPPQIPYQMPYGQYQPAYPEPLVTWDPLERQR